MNGTADEREKDKNYMGDVKKLASGLLILVQAHLIPVLPNRT